MNFVNNDLSSTIFDNVILKDFPLLNYGEQKMLHKYLIKIINYIAIKFNFSQNRTPYDHQLTQNNFQDTRGILLMLLPFINETHKSKSLITSLNDLYCSKKSSKYEYSNIQYGRCTKLSETKYEEIIFEEKHLIENFFLLKNTIHKISNKLYVNWVDIKPYYFLDKTHKLFKTYSVLEETQKKFDDKTLYIEDVYTIEDDYYKGISVQDIYEVITNKLYYEIKDVKWLIFDYRNRAGQVINYGNILQSILPIDTIISSLKYNQLSNDSKLLFDDKWNNLVSTDYKNFGKKNRAVLKMVSYYFNKYYVDNLTVMYKRFTILDNVDPDETMSRTSIHDRILFKTLKSIKSSDAYNFLYDQLKIFETTFYCKYLLETSEKNYFKTVLDLGKIGNVRLTLKNIYNYAKLFCSRIVNQKQEFYPRFWSMLEKKERNNVLEKLLHDTSTNMDKSWFNVNKYVKITYFAKGKVTPANIATYNNRIYVLVRKNIINIVFKALVYSGFLSRFEPNSIITDNDNLDKDELKKKIQIQQRIGTEVIQKEYDGFKNSYYYLTNKLYSDSVIRYNEYKNNRSTYKEMSYLDAIVSPYGQMAGWNNTYAMNWISQISFFHRYINNRVIYVTGATGVGKSTQIPKLLLYALAMVDYKSNGKIICSQPRIPPTIDNAVTISNQLGIPIKEYNQFYKKYLKSNNYSVLFKHKKDSHLISQYGLQLSIVTDGTLLETVKKYPLMKETDRAGNYIIDKNICDIVIVDEAHEHNANMDLILTFMKGATFYNNNIRLVIISATMDDDEPTYRRYFRDINDNRQFPLNIDIRDKNIDRINVDRRLHISPPGLTTRFTITEIYEENKTPEEIVMHIAQTSIDGDIILFQPGTKEIRNSIAKLNSILPSNFIALPFYSELSVEKTEIIKKLNQETKYNLRVPRNIPYEKTGNLSADSLVPIGTYTRVVIVATNVAEASITIDSLRYVVDTGTEKTNKYDYNINQGVISLGYISESSRLQRKGRVGRVAPGTVYYNYPKGTMENNVKKYGISIGNIGDTLFDLLASKDLPYFDDLDFNTIDAKINYRYGLQVIYEQSYTIMGEPYNYFGIESKNYNSKIYKIYKSGYDKKSLDDVTGTFYIVHPNEPDFIRNIMGTIIGNKPELASDTIEKEVTFYKSDNSISSVKMKTFWKTMLQKHYMYIDSNTTSNAGLNVESLNNSPSNNVNYVKTKYGNYVQQLKPNLTDYTPEEITAMIYGKKYGVINLVVLLICFMRRISYQLSNLAYLGNYEKFFNTYRKSGSTSDVTSLMEICESILKNFEKYSFIKKENYYKQLTYSKNDYKNKNFGNIDPSLYEKLKKVDYENSLKDGAVNEIELRKIFGETETIIIDLSEYEKEISTWCEKNCLEFEIVKRSVTDYLSIMFRIDNLIKDSDVYDSLNIVSGELSITSKVNLAFITGFAANLFKKINGSTMYFSVLKPSTNFVYQHGNVRYIYETLNYSTGDKMLRRKYFTNTFMSNYEYNNYVISLYRDKSSLSMLICVKDLYLLGIINPFMYITENLQVGSLSIINNKYIGEMNYNVNRNIDKTIIDIKTDLKSINSYDILYKNYQRFSILNNSYAFQVYLRELAQKKIII